MYFSSYSSHSHLVNPGIVIALSGSIGSIIPKVLQARSRIKSCSYETIGREVTSIFRYLSSCSRSNSFLLVLFIQSSLVG